MATIAKKLVDCYWYLQNQCVKGEACEYRHWAPALENPIVCNLWTEGKCQNKECNFRHPSASLGKKTTVCYYFTHGGCMKGSSCPFSHDVDVDAVAAAAPAKITADIEAAKKKEQEELRRIKEERRKEEERLAKIKAEEEAIQRKKRMDERQARNNQKTGLLHREKGAAKREPKAVQEVYRPKASNTERSSGFVKSLEEIQREKQKQEKANQKQEEKKPIQKKPEEPQKGKILRQRGTKTTKDSDSTEQPSFGVKSFAEILKEKQMNSNGSTTEAKAETPAAPANNASTPAKTTSPPAKRASNLKSLEDLRKKNQEKFKTATSPTLTKRPADSPSIGSPQQKKMKPSEPAAPATTPAPASSTPKSDVDVDLDLGDNDGSEINIDDEFDKEFNELESLMEA